MTRVGTRTAGRRQHTYIHTLGVCNRRDSNTKYMSSLRVLCFVCTRLHMGPTSTDYIIPSIYVCAFPLWSHRRGQNRRGGGEGEGGAHKRCKYQISIFLES